MFKIILRTITSFIRTSLGVYVRPRRYKQIFDEINIVKPKVIMEVGTWNGVRAEDMIRASSKYNSINDIHYVGFDLFEKMNENSYKQEVSKLPPSESSVRIKLENTGAKITLFSGYTKDTMQLVESFPKPDLVFIDGGHASETVQNDWQGIQKVMHSNTTVIFDDYWYNRQDGPKTVIDKIDRNRYKVEFMPETDVFFNPDFGRLVISLVKVKIK